MTTRALVVGDGGGVARAIVRALATEGGGVAWLSGQPEGPADVPAGVIVSSCNLGVMSEVAPALDDLRGHVGGFDRVVTIAAQPLQGLVGDTSLEAWRHSLASLEMAFVVAHQTIDDLVQTRGCLVAVLPPAAVRGVGEHAAYAAASHGVIGLIKSMALDHARQGVRFNAVCAGHVVTDEGEFGVRETSEARIPAGRLAAPEEVAHLVAHLASQRASYATGSVMFIDGAMSSGLLKDLE